MSISPEAQTILTFVDQLMLEQDAVLLRGSVADGATITRIEEYRAGVILRRNMLRIRDTIEKIVAGSITLEQAVEDTLIELTDEKGK